MSRVCRTHLEALDLLSVPPLLLLQFPLVPPLQRFRELLQGLVAGHPGRLHLDAAANISE